MKNMKLIVVRQAVQNLYVYWIKTNEILCFVFIVHQMVTALKMDFVNVLKVLQVPIVDM